MDSSLVVSQDDVTQKKIRICNVRIEAHLIKCCRVVV